VSGGVSASDTTQQALIRDVDALIAALMADAPVSELVPITDRIAAVTDQWDKIPAYAIVELRSAVDLMLGGRGCATINALLAARSELTAPQG
jgi:hypothetical protein